MEHCNIRKMIKDLVIEQIDKKNIGKLVSKTGLSKHWFYNLAKAENPDPLLSSAIKFLSAIEHPLSRKLKRLSKECASITRMSSSKCEDISK